MKQSLVNPSWHDIHVACYNLAHQVRQYDIDYVIGITRGGLIPAVIISHILNKPVLPIDYSSQQGNGDDKRAAVSLPAVPNPEDLTYQTLLIVDDICDSGNTMKEVRKHYNSGTDIVMTAALYHKKGLVDYSAHQLQPNDPWVVFPWER